MKVIIPVLLGLAGFIALIIFGGKIFYSLGIRIYALLIILASPFHKKAAQWLKGRKLLFAKLNASFQYPNHKKVWMHCASLGEFEQGKPVLEKLKEQHPDIKILITFFSPSGYEIKKDEPLADYVSYLPLDTTKNAKRFLEIVNPDLVIFVKYEYWLNLISELANTKTPQIIISAIFTKKLIFFKWYGRVFKLALKKFNQIFVQDEASHQLLNSYKIPSEIAYDTRFDRVLQIAEKPYQNAAIEKFCMNSDVIVAGSVWPKDADILSTAFYHSLMYHKFKLIIAPHEISGKKWKKSKAYFKENALLYSELEAAAEKDLYTKKILIVDNIGKLSSLYRCGIISYIGGGFNKGIHNILEAAVYGKPLIFGTKYKKFKEANDLLEEGGAFSITGAEQLKETIQFMSNIPSSYLNAGKINKQYVLEHAGGSEKITEACKKYLS